MAQSRVELLAEPPLLRRRDGERLPRQRQLLHLDRNGADEPGQPEPPVCWVLVLLGLVPVDVGQPMSW